MDCLGPSHCASVLFRKIDQHIANRGGGVMAPQDNAIGIPDEVIVEPVDRCRNSNAYLILKLKSNWIIHLTQHIHITL